MISPKILERADLIPVNLKDGFKTEVCRGVYHVQNMGGAYRNREWISNGGPFIKSSDILCYEAPIGVG